MAQPATGLDGATGGIHQVTPTPSPRRQTTTTRRHQLHIATPFT